MLSFMKLMTSLFSVHLHFIDDHRQCFTHDETIFSQCLSCDDDHRQCVTHDGTPKAEGPIRSLPPELLNHIMGYLPASAILSFRQISRHFYQNACFKSTLNAARKGFFYPSEKLAFHCMMERDGRLPEKYLVCSGCRFDHGLVLFDSTEKLLPPQVRLCSSVKGGRKADFPCCCRDEHRGQYSHCVLVCSACKTIHSLDMFDIIEQLKPPEKRICIDWGMLYQTRSALLWLRYPELQARRWRRAGPT